MLKRGYFLFFFFWNFQNKNFRKNNCNARNIRITHLFKDLCKLGHTFVKRARSISKEDIFHPRTMATVNKYYHYERSFRHNWFSIRQYQRTRIDLFSSLRAIFHHAGFLPLRSQLKSQDLSWWFHASSVHGETLYYSFVR